MAVPTVCLLYLLYTSTHTPCCANPNHSPDPNSNQARYLNTQALLRKYAPLAFVLMLVLGMLWWRFR